MDLNEYQKIIDRMRTEFNIDNFDSSLLEDKSQREFWKELLDYMNQTITDRESVNGVAKSVPMDISSIADKSFKEIGDKIDLDYAQINSNGTNTFTEKIFNLAKNGNLNFWNESVNSLIEKYLETISDQAAGEFSEGGKNPYKNWTPPTGSDHIVNEKGSIKINKENGIGAFRISDIKNANAATDFNNGPWVRPQYNVDGETFSMVRGDDKSEYALNNEKETQFTRKMTDEEKKDTGTSSVAANWIRLIMPKYLRYVEVEDLNRNFWVISQTLTAISAFLFDNDSFFSIFGDILGEIAQLWENVLYLWIALMELNQKDFYSKIHYEVVYLSNSDYEPYMKYDHFDGKNYITYKQEDEATVVDTDALWDKIDMDLKYLIADYPECNLCIIPIIRINNYRHNYFNTIAYPGVWYYDRNQEEMGHKEFFVDTNTEDQIINPDAHLDINNQIMYMGEESSATVEQFYEEEFFHTSNKGVNEAWTVSVSAAYNLTYNGITKSYSAPYRLTFYDSNNLPIGETTELMRHGTLDQVDLPYGTMKIGVLKVIAYNPADFNTGANSSEICESINDIPSGMEYSSGGTAGYLFTKKLPKLNDGIDSSIFYPNHLFKMNLQQDFFQSRVCALKETEDIYKYCVPLSNVSMDNYSTYYGLLRPEYKIYGVQIDEENKLDFSSFYFSIEFRDVAKEMIMIDTAITQEDIPAEEYRKPDPAYNLLNYTNTLVLKEIFQKRRGEDNIRLTLLQYILPDKDSSIIDKSLEIKRGYYQGELVSAHRARLGVSTNVEKNHFALIPVYKKEWAHSRIGEIEVDESFNEANGYSYMIDTGLLDFDKISEAYGKINQLLIRAANDDTDNSYLDICLNQIGLGADVKGLIITDQARFKSEFNSWLRYQPPTLFLTIKIDSGSSIVITDGITTINGIAVLGEFKTKIPNFGTWTITATLNGETVTDTIIINLIKNYQIELSYTKIYGVEWDLTTKGKVLSRTDDSALFTDPVPFVNDNNTPGSSPFDNLYPWKDMTIVQRDGNSLVKIPKFWVKIEKTAEKLTFKIADKPTAGFMVSPAHRDRGNGEKDFVYIGRYHSDSTYKSVSGQTPITNITRATARTNVHNLGSGYWQLDISMWLTIWLLYLVEFANWDGQACIGYNCGNNSSKQATGSTDLMPYHTGAMQTSRTTYGVGVQYRYIEDPWGNVLDQCDGITFNLANIYCFENFADYSDNYTSTGATLVGTRSTSSGYIQDFEISSENGFEWFMYPSSVGNSQNNVPDSCYYNASGVVLCVGGSYYQNADYGLFCLGGSGSAPDWNGAIGVRLQYIPSMQP